MLKHDPTIRLDKVWEDFEEKGLCPEIHNLDDYRAKFSGNAIQLEKALLGWSQPIVDPAKIRELHGILYVGIYPWAGTFRTHNLPCRGRDGAAPENIQAELEMLQEQMRILMEETYSQTALFRIAAFQHTRLSTIQAFGDGNTRMSRAVTSALLHGSGNLRLAVEIDKNDYLDALEAALGQENLAPLSNLLREIHGAPKEKTNWVPSPFQTTNQLDAIIYPNCLKRTFRQRPEILDGEIPTKANFLIRWPWDRVAQTVGGTPTETYLKCQDLWEETRAEEQTLPEIGELIRQIENKKPLKGRLFGEKPCWNTLRYKLKPAELAWNHPDGPQPE